jgi:hypothetical protein
MDEGMRIKFAALRRKALRFAGLPEKPMDGQPMHQQGPINQGLALFW